MVKTKNALTKDCRQDRIFNVCNFILITILFICVLYPLLLVVSSSFSSGTANALGKVRFLPVEPTLDGYKEIIEYKNILTGYKNSIFYLVVGTFVNVALTTLAAYPLSRTDLKGRKGLTLFFVFTMLFNGGLIPTYLLIKNLNLIDTRAVMILPKALSAWNVMVMISYFRSSIPSSLHDAARIDGCSDFGFLLKIVIPISKPILAVIALFYAIIHWNSYFDAMIYLNDSSKFPLQIFLKEILLSAQISFSSGNAMSLTPEQLAARMSLSETLKYSLIVISSLPLMLMYPFVQKHFVKGMMIGSIKE